MCVIEQLQIPIWNEDFMESYTFIIWVIGLFVLLYWIFELIFIRNIFRCSSKRFGKWRRSFSSLESITNCFNCTNCCKLQLPVAFLMILLSTLTSLLSSTLFLYSSYNPSQYTCSYAPIIAILLRFVSKHCIWGFNIVRGQMVIEMLENKYLNIFVKHSQYILSIQMIIIFTMVLIFNYSLYDQQINECYTQIPLLLLICIAFIGEFVYGIGFVYIFVKAMTTSMQRVMISLRDKDRQKTKKQLVHHLTVYLIQFLLSSFYIISITSCSNKNTFTNFQIFGAELLISNISILTLFRGRIKRFKKRIKTVRHCICGCICCWQKMNTNRNNQNKLVKYIENENNMNNMNKNRPILLPTVSKTQTQTEMRDILKDLPQLQLKEIDDIKKRKRTMSDNTSSINSPTSPMSPILSRNNSISINPLLPNSWLSPHCVEAFRISLVTNNILNQINMNQLRTLPAAHSINDNHITTPSPHATPYTSQSAPMFKHNNQNQMHVKNKYQHIQSQSTSALERMRRQIHNTNQQECIFIRSELQLQADEKNENDMNKSNSFTFSNASRSLFKKASIFKSIFTAGNSQSMPLNNLSNLAVAQPIQDILTLEDNFKFSNGSDQKERDYSLEIIYSDEVMNGIQNSENQNGDNMLNVINNIQNQ